MRQATILLIEGLEYMRATIREVLGEQKQYRLTYRTIVFADLAEDDLLSEKVYDAIIFGGTLFDPVSETSGSHGLQGLLDLLRNNATKTILLTKDNGLREYAALLGVIVIDSNIGGLYAALPPALEKILGE